MKQRVIRRSKTQAFTLIELLLVLVILAVLAAVVAPKFVNRGQQARVTAAKVDISTMESALDQFELDNGRFPTNEEGLGVLVNKPAGLDKWNGPYIKRDPVDPWGNAYVYRNPGTNNASGFDLSSLGPDGREGNDDINNWTKQ